MTQIKYVDLVMGSDHRLFLNNNSSSSKNSKDWSYLMITSFSTEELDLPAADAASSKKSARKIFGIIVFILAVLATVVGLTYAFQLWGGKNPPNVLGYSAANAEYVLQERGFEVVENYVVSDDIEGIVLSMSPSSDVRVDAGSTVKIDISKLRVIPSVVGLDKDGATSTLNESGYTKIKCVYVDSDVAADTVVNVSPSEGSQCLSTDTIEIQVSTGEVSSSQPEDVNSEDFLSKDFRPAKFDGNFVDEL